MTQKEQQQKLGKTLWDIADQLRGAMNADDFGIICFRFSFFGIYRIIMKSQP